MRPVYTCRSRALWAVTLASSYVHVDADVAGAPLLRTAAAVAAAVAVDAPVAGSVVHTAVGINTLVAADEGVSTRQHLVAVVAAAVAFPPQPPLTAAATEEREKAHGRTRFIRCTNSK